MTNRETTMSLLAAGSYWDIRGFSTYSPLTRDTSNHAPIPDGWTLIGEKSGSGSNTTLFGSGFSARAYQNKTSQEIVISYAGTEFGFDNSILGMYKDFALANIPLGVGRYEEQALHAAEFYQDIKKQHGENISFTGHSLGGGLASLMAVWFDRPAFVFAPAPFQASADKRQPNNNWLGFLAEAALGTVRHKLGENIDPAFKAYDPELMFESREQNVQSWVVKGEVLEAYLGFVESIEKGRKHLFGKIGDVIGKVDKHSIDLHAAALMTPDFEQQMNNLPVALEMVFDKRLYNHEITGDQQNFLVKLIRNEAGIRANDGSLLQSPNGMLSQFTADMGKLGDAAEHLSESAQKAIIAQGIQWYYWQSNDYKKGQAFFADSGEAVLQFTTALGDGLTEAGNGIAFAYAAPWLVPVAEAHGTFYDYRSSNSYDQWSIVISHNGGTAQARDANKTQMMVGGTGNDSFTGGQQKDIVFAGAGNDVLNGGAGDDRLYGGDGADVLEGGDGSDLLYGGKGEDAYMLSSIDSGIDTIRDPDAQGGALWLDGLNLAGSYTSYNRFLQDYYNAARDVRLNVHKRADGSQTLLVARQEADHSWKQIARVEHWKEGQFGLILQQDKAQEDYAEAPGSNAYYDVYWSGPKAVKIASGGKADNVNGSPQGDHISLGDGNDLALAGLGSDYVDGGAGNDLIMGGLGRGNAEQTFKDSDILIGGDGNDKLKGMIGNDVLYAMNQADDIEADAGSAQGDWLLGGSGDDVLYGSTGADILNGGAGHDYIRGGGGHDVILGDGGIEARHQYITLPTGTSNQYVPGPGGQLITIPGYTVGKEHNWDAANGKFKTHDALGVTVVSGASYQWSSDTSSEANYSVTPKLGWQYGKETRLEEGGGNDVIHAGAGNDWVAGQTGHDVIYGGDGNDILYGDDSVEMPAGSHGNDRLYAGAGADKLFGNQGNDWLDASEEDGEQDVLRGGEGDDTLLGGTGGDELFGDAGNDTLQAGNGNTRMEGGDGNDRYRSGTGDDTLYDTDGNDVYELSQGNDTITDLAGHDQYRLHFGSLALNGTTTVQDLDGKGSILYDNHFLTYSTVRATAQDEWQSLDQQVRLSKSGGDLVLTNATPGSAGKVVFQNFFSQSTFLGLSLPKYVAPQSEPPKNKPPVVSTVLEARQMEEDADLAFVLPEGAFTDPDRDALTYSAQLANGQPLPGWLRFDAAARSFAGLPTNEDVGRLDVRVTASDPSGASASQVFVLEVVNTNDVPEVGTPLAAQRVASGLAFGFALPEQAFVDVDAEDQLSYQAELANGAPWPAWLHFDAATRTFSGTPPLAEQDSAFTLVVTATDLAGESVRQNFTLTVAAAQTPQPPAQPDQGIVGTLDNDTLVGTTANDTINGLGGDDVIHAGAGNDRVFGEVGNDTLHGDAEDDALYGGQGNDVLYGGAGDDLLNGEDGDDLLHGGAGDDTLFGWTGSDALHGEEGDDRLHGGQGDDVLYGGAGNDLLDGEDGDDQLHGGAGDDALFGWTGNDALHGEEGDDRLYGWQGNDRLFGGAGDDLLDGGLGDDVLAGGAGSNQLFGGLGSDVYVIEGKEGVQLVVEEVHEHSASDEVHLHNLASTDAYGLARVGDDLHLSHAQQTVVVRDQFAPHAHAIEVFRFSDGVLLGAHEMTQKVPTDSMGFVV